MRLDMLAQGNSPAGIAEVLFRTIVEQSPTSTQIFAADGATIMVNRAWERRWGVTLDQIHGYNILEDEQLVAKGVMPYIRRAFAGETVDIPAIKYEPDLTRPGASAVPYRWVTASMYPVTDDEGRVVNVVLMHEDITDRVDVTERLRAAEEQYRSIFEATSDGLIINSPEGTIVEANPAVCRMHGYNYEEFIGLHPTRIVHPDYHHVLADFLRTVRSGGLFQTRAVDVRKDGSLFPVEVHGSMLDYKGKPHVLAVLRDITERVQAYELLEQRVAERTRELSTLLDISHDVASTLELQPLLGLILDDLKTVVDYTSASILVRDDDVQEVVEYRGSMPREQVVGQRVACARNTVGDTILRQRRPVIVDDILGDTPEAHAYRGGGAMHGGQASDHVRSWMGVPLVLKDRVIGELNLSHHEPAQYAASHARLALAIANQAAVAIENARLYARAQSVAALEERQRLARELHDSVSQALYGIALGAKTARSVLDDDPRHAAEALDYVLSLAEAGLTEMRALILELLPNALETDGLVAALSKQIAAAEARHGLAITATLCPEPEAPVALKEALYRIAQEALHNTVKHASARTVQLRLTTGDDQLVLDVADDGKGFDASGDYPGHLGLRTMRERAVHAGGTLDIASAPGRGTRITATIPLPQEELDTIAFDPPSPP